MSAKAETSGTRPYFPELDGVRAIAALMVMFFHFAQDWGGSRAMIFGQTGVDLFFVLSGFLITTILLQAPHGDWHEIRNFYIRRTLRIFPLYYGYLIVSVLAGASVSLWYWFYMQNIAGGLRLPLAGPNHFWSLGVEEQFYLVWPFFVLFWPRKWLAAALWGAVAFSLALRIVLLHTRIDSFTFTPTRLDGLAAGGLLAWYFSRGRLKRALPWLAVAAPLAFLTLIVEWWVSKGTGVAWVGVTKYSFAALLYVSIIGLLIGSPPTFAHILLRSRPMRAIGRVSYGMYVYHPALFVLLIPHLGSTPKLLKEIISFGCVYIVSLLSFYLYEKRFIDLKDRLAPEKKFREV